MKSFIKKLLIFLFMIVIYSIICGLTMFLTWMACNCFGITYTHKYGLGVFIIGIIYKIINEFKISINLEEKY